MNKILYFIKNKLNQNQKNKFKNILYRNNLSKLAVAFGTDKYGTHYYTQHYENHFRKLKNKKLTILEIGIGGYDDPRAGGGGSLKMWKGYFPKSQIYGIDIFEKSFHDESRIKTIQGSQIDEAFLKKVIREIGSPDIIIDDGSHLNEHVKISFEILFPLLKDDGIYVVEDTETSYWDNFAGDNWGGSIDLNADFTSMNYFKKLTDGLNYHEFLDKDYAPSYFDEYIFAIHFYRNIIFIDKGLNNQGEILKEVILRAKNMI